MSSLIEWRWLFALTENQISSASFTEAHDGDNDGLLPEEQPETVYYHIIGISNWFPKFWLQLVLVIVCAFMQLPESVFERYTIC